MPPSEYDESSVESSLADGDYGDCEISLDGTYSTKDRQMTLHCGDSVCSVESSIATGDFWCDDLNDIDIDDVNERIEITMSPLRTRGRGLKRTTSSGSIKDLLPITSIHEDKETEDEAFYTFASEKEDSSDDEEEDEGIFDFGGDDFEFDSQSITTTESSMNSSLGSDGFAILNILKKTDSKDFISSNGQRRVGSREVKDLSDDPLLNMYFNRPKSNKAEAPAVRSRFPQVTCESNKMKAGLSLVSSSKSSRPNDSSKNDRKADPWSKKNHKGALSRRRRASKEDLKKSSKGKAHHRGSARKSRVEDPLIQRYLEKSKTISSEEAKIEHMLSKSDSRGYINGKGQRVVRSRFCQQLLV